MKAIDYLKTRQYMPNEHETYVFQNKTSHAECINLAVVLDDYAEHYLKDAMAGNIIELMILTELNRYIKDKKLTYQVTVMFDGYKYHLFYQSVFSTRPARLCQQGRSSYMLQFDSLRHFLEH